MLVPARPCKNHSAARVVSVGSALFYSSHFHANAKTAQTGKIVRGKTNSKRTQMDNKRTAIVVARVLMDNSAPGKRNASCIHPSDSGTPEKYSPFFAIDIQHEPIEQNQNRYHCSARQAGVHCQEFPDSWSRRLRDAQYPGRYPIGGIRR
jgi:hypothetical protein